MSKSYFDQYSQIEERIIRIQTLLRNCPPNRIRSYAYSMRIVNQHLTYLECLERIEDYVAKGLLVYVANEFQWTLLTMGAINAFTYAPSSFAIAKMNWKTRISHGVRKIRSFFSR